MGAPPNLFAVSQISRRIVGAALSIRRTAVQLVVRAVTIAVLLALIACVAKTLKFSGTGSQSKRSDLFDPTRPPS